MWTTARLNTATRSCWRQLALELALGVPVHMSFSKFSSMNCNSHNAIKYYIHTIRNFPASHPPWGHQRLLTFTLSHMRCTSKNTSSLHENLFINPKQKQAAVFHPFEPVSKRALRAVTLASKIPQISEIGSDSRGGLSNLAWVCCRRYILFLYSTLVRSKEIE